jgi:hypothetical protein
MAVAAVTAKRYHATHTLCERLLIALLKAKRPVTVVELAAMAGHEKVDIVARLVGVYVDTGLCAREREREGRKDLVVSLTRVGLPVATAAKARPVLDPTEARQAFQSGVSISKLAGDVFLSKSVKEFLKSQGVERPGVKESAKRLNVVEYRYAHYLSAIARLGGNATVRNISTETSVGKKAIYRLLTGAREQGFVNAAMLGSGDARKIFELTDAGKRVIELRNKIDPHEWRLRYENGEGLGRVAGELYTPRVALEVLKGIGVRIRTR